jgi:hypothetical protein
MVGRNPHRLGTGVNEPHDRGRCNLQVTFFGEDPRDLAVRPATTAQLANEFFKGSQPRSLPPFGKFL